MDPGPAGTAAARHPGSRRSGITVSREGVALPVTVWALVTAGLLLTVATFIGFHEQRAAANGRRLRQALARAESRFPSVLRDWTPGRLNRRLPSPFDSLVGAGPHPTVIHRLGDGLYLFRSPGIDTGGNGAARAAITVTAGQLLTVRPTAVPVHAALTAGDTVALDDGSAIDGNDTPPPGWLDCAPGDSAVAGVLAESLTGGVVAGSPAIMRRQRTDSLHTLDDTLVFDSLAVQATVRLPGGTWQTPPQRFGLECQTGLDYNWGDPADPQALCGGYLPIIHVGGDLTLSGGEGQGILLVDGNLSFTGAYRFYGLVLVRGRLDVPIASGAVIIRGAVAARRVQAGSPVLSSFEVTFSKCIVNRVLRSSGRLIPLRSRSWKQLFEVP
jgi:hypothetical protein